MSVKDPDLKEGEVMTFQCLCGRDHKKVFKSDDYPDPRLRRWEIYCPCGEVWQVILKGTARLIDWDDPRLHGEDRKKFIESQRAEPPEAPGLPDQSSKS